MPYFRFQQRTMRFLIQTAATLGLLASGTSMALAESPMTFDPMAGHTSGRPTPHFDPIVSTRDYISSCGDYQRINQSESLQRLSKNWQRCFAYTSATIAALRDIERTAVVKQFCVPQNISTEYTIDVTVKYARKIPETLEENPAKIMLEALAVRYPC